jgi:hypothetical protein
MPGIMVELNVSEIWDLINAHIDAESRHSDRREYMDAISEKARADYLKTLVETPTK